MYFATVVTGMETFSSAWSRGRSAGSGQVLRGSARASIERSHGRRWPPEKPVPKGGSDACPENRRRAASRAPVGARQGSRCRGSRLVPKILFPALLKLAPCEKARAPLAFQQKAIDLMMENPRRSFAFFGDAGAGKTTLATWLFAQAIARSILFPDPASGARRRPCRGSASEIVRAHHVYITTETDEYTPPEPPVTARLAGWHPTYISEMEKIGSMTDYKYEVLFTIFEKLYESRPDCQLVMDSNLKLEEFEAHFTDKISRRVAELCYRVNYFEEEILVPTEEKMR